MRKVFFYIVLFVICNACNTQNVSNQVYVVDIEDVFESYQMQKELRKQVDEYSFQNQGFLDSLTVKLNLMAEDLDSNPHPTDEQVKKYQQMFRYCAQEKEAYESELQDLIGKYDGMIMKRINEALPLFAKEMGAKLILTKGGAFPAALYCSESMEVTDSFIEYLNAEYNG